MEARVSSTSWGFYAGTRTRSDAPQMYIDKGPTEEEGRGLDSDVEN